MTHWILSHKDRIIKQFKNQFWKYNEIVVLLCICIFLWTMLCRLIACMYCIAQIKTCFKSELRPFIGDEFYS